MYLIMIITLIKLILNNKISLVYGVRSDDFKLSVELNINSLITNKLFQCLIHSLVSVMFWSGNFFIGK